MVRTILDYLKREWRASERSRVEVRKGNKIYIWWSDWWGDALSIIEGNTTVKWLRNDDRINEVLDEIADKVTICEDDIKGEG